MPPPPDRRGVILAQAADLFARQGVAATTVREIAEAAGILSGSLYHHFASKDEIVDAVVSGFLQDLRSRYEALLDGDDDATTQLRGLIQASLATVAAHPHAAEVYQNDAHQLRAAAGFPAVEEGVRAVRAAWLKVLEDGVQQGLFRSDVPVRVLYPLLRDGLWLTARWFRPTRAYDHARLADDYWRLFVEGLAGGGRAGAGARVPVAARQG